MSEEVKFNFNEDIIYQIEMMSYMEYNNKLCSINEHLGEIYSYQDLNDTEQAQLKYEKKLSYKAIKQLQTQLQQKENIIKEARENIENHTTEFNYIYIPASESWYLLEILDKENRQMKVIDLLNKIANGEEVPKKIRITDIDDRITRHYNFLYDEDEQEYKDDELFPLGARLILDRVLNKKVEILDKAEENK